MIAARKNWFASAHNAAGQNDFYRSKAKKHTSVIKAKERELERLENNKIDKPEKTVTPAYRYFTGRIANRIFEIRDQAVRCYEGNYDYYLSKSRHEQMNANTDGDLNQISDNIRRLECQLAFISGKLAEPAEEAVKEHLNAEFIKVARELNQYKETVKRLQK